MNPDVKKEWTEALRSGEYPQTAGTLRDDVGFCCLGVLCEIAVKHGVIPEVSVEDINGKNFYDYDRATATPSRKVIEWAGLPDSNPTLGEYAAAEWNDEQGKGFNEIADLIDKHL